MNTRNVKSRLAAAALRGLLAPAAALALSLLSASAARAAALQTFVSVNGNDSNTASNCPRTSPCRLIKTALTVTSPGGVLTVLDSGGFGGFGVTQSVQVVAAPGVQATIVPVAPNPDVAVLVDAPGASVTLRGLYILTPGPAIQQAIYVLEAGSVHVEGCVLVGAGVDSSGGIFAQVESAEVYISDTVVRRFAYGIFVRSDEADALKPTRAVIERVRVENCHSVGVSIHNNVDAVLRDSVSSGGGIGVRAAADVLSRKAEMVVENCLVTGNSIIGIRAEGAAGGQGVVDVEGTTIAFNGTGLSTSENGGFINSRKDNTLRRNQTPGAFTTTFTPQ